MITADQALTRAVDMLKTDGWTTGKFKCGDTGERCAIGALRAAVFADEHPYISSSTYKTNRGLGRVYNKALLALARAINPKVDRDVAEAKKDSEEYSEPWTLADEVEHLEDLVIGFNDRLVRNSAGRRTILGRFTKAAKAVSV